MHGYVSKSSYLYPFCEMIFGDKKTFYSWSRFLLYRQYLVPTMQMVKHKTLDAAQKKVDASYSHIYGKTHLLAITQVCSFMYGNL